MSISRILPAFRVPDITRPADLGAIAEGGNQVTDPERKQRESAEGRKNGEAVSQYSPGLRRSRYPGKRGEDYHNLEEVA
jgi:hypothetical protein